MWAWRLTRPGGSLEYRDVPRPQVRAGTVRVRLHAVPLLSYLRAFVAGELPQYAPPGGEFTPGTNGVGMVDAVGPDVFHVHPGDRVLVSPHLVAAENVDEPTQVLTGLTAMSGERTMIQCWADGTLADAALVPAAAVTVVPRELGDGAPESVRLAALSRCVVPYGGLLRGRLAPGETLVVHGATGAYGSAAVLVALAMGAGRIVAYGRNADMLATLAELPRVHAVPATGDREADAAALRDAADGGAHCALDMVGRADSPAGTLAALGSLHRYGRLVLMGGVTAPVPLDYGHVLRQSLEIVGNFMYPRDAYLRLLRMVVAGTLDLHRIPMRQYPMKDLPEAMAVAERPGAPLVVMTN